jgi:hypothetical protein
MRNTLQSPRETATEGVFRAIRQAILYIAIAGVLGAIVGIGATEAIGAALARALPGGSTHIAALVVGLLLGYAAAATATIWALISGIAQTIGTVAVDLERAGERVVHGLESLAEVQARPAGTTVLPPRTLSGVTARARSPLSSGVLVGMPGAVPPGDMQPVESRSAESTMVSGPFVPATR